MKIIITVIVCVVCELFIPYVKGGSGLSPVETELATRITEHSGQSRANLAIDSALSDVARAHSCDMAHNGFFAHINHQNIGPNKRIQNAGITLPSYYSQDVRANNVESLAGGFDTPEKALQGLLESPLHREHILAENTFYERQTRIGIGYCYAEGSQYTHYWTILTYEPVT